MEMTNDDNETFIMNVDENMDDLKYYVTSPAINPLVRQCYYVEHSHSYIYSMHIKSK
jgi:hypothetical protein